MKRMRMKWSLNVFNNKFDSYSCLTVNNTMDLIKDLILLNRSIEINTIVNKYNESEDEDEDEDQNELLERIKEKYKELLTKQNHIQFKLTKLN